MVSSDEGRLELRQYRNFLDDIFHLVFGIFNVDDLDGDGLSCSSIDPGLHVNEVLSLQTDAIGLTLCTLCQSFPHLLCISHGTMK